MYFMHVSTNSQFNCYEIHNFKNDNTVIFHLINQWPFQVREDEIKCKTAQTDRAKSKTKERKKNGREIGLLLFILGLMFRLLLLLFLLRCRLNESKIARWDSVCDVHVRMCDYILSCCLLLLLLLFRFGI